MLTLLHRLDGRLFNRLPRVLSVLAGNQLALVDRHRLQLVVGVGQKLLEVAEVVVVPKVDHQAWFPLAPGPARPVNVAIRRVRQLEVNHRRELRNVQAPGRHVCR